MSTPTAPVVFLDTETTGLSDTDEVWEFAGIRRDHTGETTLHLFIEHSAAKAALLPKPFLDDHTARYDPTHAINQVAAARLIHRLLEPTTSDEGPLRAHVVGAVPNFDTAHLTRLLNGAGLKPNWHYHLIDIEALAVGYLQGQRTRGSGPGPADQLPWSSDALTRALHLTVDDDSRHTAMGDTLWARAVYDRVMTKAAR